MAVVFRHHIEIDVLGEGFARDGVSKDGVLHAAAGLLYEVVVDLVGEIDTVAQNVSFRVAVPLHEHGTSGVHYGFETCGRGGGHIVLNVVDLRKREGEVVVVIDGEHAIVATAAVMGLLIDPLAGLRGQQVGDLVPRTFWIVGESDNKTFQVVILLVHIPVEGTHFVVFGNNGIQNRHGRRDDVHHLEGFGFAFRGEVAESVESFHPVNVLYTELQRVNVADIVL